MINRQIRVLIVEDDYLVSQEIKRTLRGGSYDIVAETNNGEDAVKIAQELSPDVILMDIKMPKMDGLTAAGLIQEQHPTPIVILTSHESRDMLVEASRVGAGAFLTKPPRLAEIDRAVTIAMARHRDLMEIRQLYEDLQEAGAKITRLEGILPICMHCKQIRDQDGNWSQLEKYISDHSKAAFSHGICPDCLQEHYPDYADDLNP